MALSAFFYPGTASSASAPASSVSTTLTSTSSGQSVKDCQSDRSVPGENKAGTPPTPLVHVDRVLSPKERDELFAKVRAARPMARGRGGKAREIKTILNFTQSASTAAATDYVGVINVNPSASTEYASFAALWDELIVDSGRLEFTITPTTTFTSNNGAARAVVCFDPIDSTALGSISNGLQHQQHLHFCTSTAIYQQFPLPMNHNGIWRFDWRTPRGNARTTGNAGTFGHEWSATGDTNDFYGYLKWFIPTGGAAGIWSIYYTWTLNCRFRCRT